MWPAAPKAHPAILTMRSRPLIRSPAQISSPDVGQRQSRLVLREYTHFCLPGTLLLSCDQTDSPRRPSPPDIRRCFNEAVRRGRRQGRGRTCLLPGTPSHGSLRFSVGVDVLKDIAEVCPTSTFFLRYGGSVDGLVESLLLNKADIVPGPSALGLHLDLRIRVQPLNQCNPRRISSRCPISFTPIPAPGRSHQHRES